MGSPRSVGLCPDRATVDLIGTLHHFLHRISIFHISLTYSWSEK